MTTNEFKIVRMSFQDIAINKNEEGDRIISDIERVANTLLYREPRQGRNLLRDEVDYKGLLQAPFVKKTNFGDVFVLYNNEEKPIGFLIALCNHQFIKSKATKVHRGITFPFDHCGIWFRHDIPYLKDLNTLGTFAFCFQLGVIKEYQNDYNCGSTLLDSFEQHYCTKEGNTPDTKSRSKTLLIAASIHENQFQVIQLLKKRNRPEYINRHAANMPELDFKVLFLDHYFDPNTTRGHWFRVVQIPDTKAFSKEINYKNIRQAFSTIIPIQLNQAVNQINRVIANMGAKMTWASFFHDNQVLEEKYELARENYGFFLSLLEANENDYFDLLDKASEIMDYLKSKSHNRADVASLTKAFDKNTAEIFFFNREPEEMKSFVNPKILDLSDEEKAYQTILDFAKQQGVIKNGLTEEEATAWRTAFLRDLQSSTEETRAEKALYVDRLGITKEEVKILEAGIFDRYKSQFPKELAKKVSRPREFSSTVKRINNSIPSLKTQDAWRKYIHLHKKLYEIDAASWEKEDDYKWCHAIIPINFSPISKTLGVMFCFYCKRDEANGSSMTQKDDKMDALAHLISAALPRYLLNNLIKIQENDAIELATRYGIAAVTTRNMAHHVGSHILAHTSNPSTIYKFRKEIFFNDFDEQVARFHEYLRAKTHLLADMISSNPVSSVSRWLDAEILSQFNKQAILTKYVSGTHIEAVDVQYRDCNHNKKDDILVQIPNGDLGVHSFFMIITNMIRNVAKYEPTQNLKQLTITVRVIPTPEQRQAGEIMDENHRLTTSYGSDRGYEILLYDNVPRNKKKLRRLILKLNEDLRNHTARLGNNIRVSGWGLLEMSSAAAYLRKKNVEATHNKGMQRVDIPLITAEPYTLRAYEIQDQKGRPHKVLEQSLAYRIYLKKPRLALVIHFDEERRASSPQWGVEYGLRFTSVSELNSKQQNSFTHDFALAFSSKTRENVEFAKRFPLRWVNVYTSENFLQLSELFSISDGKPFHCWVWEKWVAEFSSRKQLDFNKIRLCFSDLPEKFSTDLDTINLLYDLHGTFKKGTQVDTAENIFFYQQYGSVCPTGRVLSNLTGYNDYDKKILDFKLIEAALTEVVIIDERIQRQSLEIGTGEDSHIEQLRRMNIYLPNPKQQEPDLYHLQSLKEIETWLATKLVGTYIDFVVLHLGLLESWLGSDINKIAQWIEDKVVSKNRRAEIILISGRGRHIQFPARYLYQPVSTISEFIISKSPSKLHLTQILFSSRTRLKI